MKKINTWYWITTIIFGGFMLMSGIAEVRMAQQEIDMFKGLGYPTYLIPFLGVLKIVGVIVLVLPRFPRLKEWAYAGFFFDLLGAFYSANAASPTFDPRTLFMFLFFAFFFASYFLWHAKLKKRSEGKLSLAA